MKEPGRERPGWRRRVRSCLLCRGGPGEAPTGPATAATFGGTGCLSFTMSQPVLRMLLDPTVGYYRLKSGFLGRHGDPGPQRIADRAAQMVEDSLRQAA